MKYEAHEQRSLLCINFIHFLQKHTNEKAYRGNKFFVCFNSGLNILLRPLQEDKLFIKWLQKLRYILEQGW
jgi:hypothetical protein